MRFCLLAVFFVVGVRAQLLIPHASCSNKCFLPNDYSRSCQCDFDCETYGNCCFDFWSKCRGSEYGLVVTNSELNTFAQDLWNSDVNRIDSALYSLNYQNPTTPQDTTDVASENLIVPTDSQLDAILANPNCTYHSFIRLLNNYNPNRIHSESHPAKEIAEETSFWNAIVNTQVIQKSFRFLVDNGYIKGDIHAFRTVVNEMWFLLYPHNKHSQEKSDSGFERVMIGEYQPHPNPNSTIIGSVLGFNNWIQYYQEQQAGKLDYNGYIKYAQDPNMVDVRFTWRNAMAKSSSFFVGTSPEFDLSLYTVCAVISPSRACSFSINGNHITVRTSLLKHGQLQQLTAAYPVFHSTAPTASA